MIKIKLSEIAENQGLSQAETQRLAQLPINKVRLLWHNRNYNRVDLAAIERLCDVLEVPLCDMLKRE